MKDIECYAIHTQENQSFLVNAATHKEAFKIVAEYGYTPLGWNNVFIPINSLVSIENILS